MKPQKVWRRNRARIGRVIEAIGGSYRLDGSFPLEAENIFYANFDKYYEHDKQYLRFYFTCLNNKAKNIYRERRTRQKLITVVETESGCKDIFDMIEAETSLPSFESEIVVKEIEQYLKNNLGEVEYFVYEQLLEGWTIKDIAEMLDTTVGDVNKVRTLLKQELLAITA